MLHREQLKLMLQIMRVSIVYLLIFIDKIVAPPAGDPAASPPRERQLRGYNGKNFLIDF